MKAPQCAGVIHSDFERGFIRAEVVSYEDLAAAGNMATVKEQGRYRSEGKEYVFQTAMSSHSLQRLIEKNRFNRSINDIKK